MRRGRGRRDTRAVQLLAPVPVQLDRTPGARGGGGAAARGPQTQPWRAPSSHDRGAGQETAPLVGPRREAVLGTLAKRPLGSPRSSATTLARHRGFHSHLAQQSLFARALFEKVPGERRYPRSQTSRNLGRSRRRRRRGSEKGKGVVLSAEETTKPRRERFFREVPSRTLLPVTASLVECVTAGRAGVVAVPRGRGLWLGGAWRASPRRSGPKRGPRPPSGAANGAAGPRPMGCALGASGSARPLERGSGTVAPRGLRGSSHVTAARTALGFAAWSRAAGDLCEIKEGRGLGWEFFEEFGVFLEMGWVG